MTTECYFGKCPHHSNNSGNPHDEGPFCHQPKCLATPAQNALWAEERKNQLSMLTMTPNAPVDFDAWMAHPYTAVLFKSIAEDYVPKADLPDHVARPGEREAFEAYWEEQEASRAAHGGNFEGPATRPLGIMQQAQTHNINLNGA